MRASFGLLTLKYEAFCHICHINQMHWSISICIVLPSQNQPQRWAHFCRHSKLPRRSRRCQLTKPTHRPSFGGKESFASHGRWHGGRAVVWLGMQTTRKFRLKRYTSPKTNKAPEKWLSKKESSRPNHDSSLAMLSFQGCNVHMRLLPIFALNHITFIVFKCFESLNPNYM